MTNNKFIFLGEVESTNNYANQLILSKAAVEGTVVLAQHQKNGRGQQGNAWESEAGKNLLASLILFPAFMPASKQFYLSKIASLALVDLIKTETNNVYIKWPNDIYVGNKKISGILIENSIKGQNLATSIIGLGLNLNQEKFLSDAPNPVSLKQTTGATYEIEIIAELLFEKFNFWYRKLENGYFKEIDSTYFKSLYRVNQWCTYSKQGEEFEAQIVGIGEFGQLILEDRNKKLSEYLFKEVEFII